MWSDVVCPWCYLGLVRFRRALDDLEWADEVELVFQPFQLDPSAPSTSSPVIDTYARKFGGHDNAMRIIAEMTATAAAEGLDFHLDRALRVNTFDAHRLEELARVQGRGEAVYERLLAAYFTEGLDLGDHEVLIRLGAEAGLDDATARGWLAGDGGVAEVREGLGTAAALGITAVPTFVIDRRAMIPGAQDPDTLVTMLQRLRGQGGDDVR